MIAKQQAEYIMQQIRNHGKSQLIRNHGKLQLDIATIQQIIDGLVIHDNNSLYKLRDSLSAMIAEIEHRDRG